MKKLFSLLLVVGLLFSCAQAGILQNILDVFRKDTITINGIDYSDGFYGELYPQFSPSDTGFEHNGKQFYHVAHPHFDLICCRERGFDSLFCVQSQWQDAASYYRDVSNFSFFCQIGAQYADRNPVIMPLPSMDAEMYDRLMAFVAENDYNPFSKDHPDNLLRIPEPDRDISPQLIFYTESKDGLFTSSKGHKFHIIDGNLLFVYYYDANHGEKDELVAVPVPDEIGLYFVSLLQK